MTCKICKSENQNTFSGDLNIHFPGRNKLTKPAVLVFPNLIVCQYCGHTEFEMAEAELCKLREGIQASA